MNEIQIKNKTLTSMEVAEMVEKRHTDLLRDIRTYIDQIEEINERKIASVDFFLENTYLDKKGEERPCYLITRKGCEFIANKLTGVKGTKFTASYINRFHEMEQVIKENITPIQNLEELKIRAQLERAEAMKLNAKTRMFNTIMKTTNNKVLSPVAIEVFGLKAIEQITGIDMGQHLPQVSKTYSATEIGNMLGVSANMIGTLAKNHNLKTEENGIWVMDKSKFSSKEVSTFRYFENAINIFKGLLA
ncbi:MAG: Rha family transcriptional regulator [Lachnospirales bacterium]